MNVRMHVCVMYVCVCVCLCVSVCVRVCVCTNYMWVMVCEATQLLSVAGRPSEKSVCI